MTFKIMSKVENKLMHPKLDTGAHGHKKFITPVTNPLGKESLKI